MTEILESGRRTFTSIRRIRSQNAVVLGTLVSKRSTTYETMLLPAILVNDSFLLLPAHRPRPASPDPLNCAGLAL